MDTSTSRITPVRVALLLGTALLASPLFAQTEALTLAPGITLTNGSIPYATDHFAGTPQAVPIHHSDVSVNQHTGRNVAGAMAGSFFYKPKQTVELTGEHARSVVHDLSPNIYFHMAGENDPDGSPQSNSVQITLVRATVEKGHRVLTRMAYTQLTGNAKRDDLIVPCDAVQVENNWTRLTPTTPLQPGEYAVVPVPKDPHLVASVVYDFRVDPEAGNVTDAIAAPTR